jgi:phytoene desaturase
MKKRIAIIGAGISGLSAAAYAAKAGNEVHVFEKNSGPGGRARQFKTSNGYLFDMGPSWYWMPDIINNFFQDFGHEARDFYELVSLDPQFEMVFADGIVAVPKEMDSLKEVFEKIEPGSSHKLEAFMNAAQYKYEVAMKSFVEKPCYSWWEFVRPSIAKTALQLDLLTNFRSYVKKYFTHPKLIALMEFPVIFLGASPKNIPAMYSLMNYGGYGLGTWYPMGGFYKLVEAMQSLAEQQGVQFHFDAPVEKIIVENGSVQSIMVHGSAFEMDAVIASSDYHHSELLLEKKYRNYSENYWEQKTFAPSCLIYYLGFKTSIPKLKHHTLFFENDLDAHIEDIYAEKQWPKQPLFYVCCPSKTDKEVAPLGHENLFLLMPLATGINDEEEIRVKYLREMLSRIEKYTGQENLIQQIDYKKSYCVSDFENDYNAYKGNAYGLANTLSQTAVLKPSIKNKKLSNLFYTGQLTVPGPGVPPSLISGKIVAQEVNKIKKTIYESAF